MDMGGFEMNNNIAIFGFNVSNLSVDTIVKNALENNKLSVVNTINPHSYIETKSDSGFYDALQDSDILIPDGSGIVLAAKMVNKVKIGKIAGTDLFYESMKQLNTTNGKVFFLGSSDNVLKAMTEKGNNEFPNVSVQTLSPPYKAKFDQSDIDSFIKAINTFKPDVLFVGLTAPKQEKLIHQIKSQIDVKMVSGIGAVFDFYAGAVIRPHPFWLKLHLEWLVRLIGEPKRLWRRNFVSTPLFLLEIFLTKLGLKKFS
ncbi:MAG: N-acetylglucosaminyldiphosphoundecaprenol N-acetyl-beta-D-mannosaminyltransferase [Oceanospirillaceae bacterium]